MDYSVFNVFNQTIHTRYLKAACITFTYPIRPYYLHCTWFAEDMTTEAISDITENTNELVDDDKPTAFSSTDDAFSIVR